MLLMGEKLNVVKKKKKTGNLQNHHLKGNYSSRWLSEGETSRSGIFLRSSWDNSSGTLWLPLPSSNKHSYFGHLKMPVDFRCKADLTYSIADGTYDLLLLKIQLCDEIWGLAWFFSWWVIFALGIPAWNPSHTSCRTSRSVSPGVWNALRLTYPPRSCYGTHWPITETRLALE